MAQVDALPEFLEAGHLLRVGGFLGVQDDRHVGQAGLATGLFHEMLDAHVRQIGIENQAIDAPLAENVQGFGRGLHRTRLHFPLADPFEQVVLLVGIRFEDEQVFNGTVDEILDRAEAALQRLALAHGLGNHAQRPRAEGLFAHLFSRNDVHRNVPRLAVVLQAFQDAPAVDVRQADVQGERRGFVFADHGQGRRTQRRHQPPEAGLASDVQQQAGKAEIVLDDQQDLVPRLDGVAIVARFVDRFRRFLDLGRALRLRFGLDGAVGLGGLLWYGAELARRLWWREGLRQIEREGTATAGTAHEANLAAQQAGQLAANGQAQTGAAVLAAGAAVGLLKGLEDDLLLLRLNADARVGHRKRRHGLRPVEVFIVRAPALQGRFDIKRHLAVVREFERIGQQVLEDLLQALGIGEEELGQVRVHFNGEFQALGLSHVPEGALDVAVQIGETNLAEVDRHRAGLDLGEVENVIDEH